MNKPASRVAFFELPADNVTRAAKFYGTVFGWDTPPLDGGGVFALTTAADGHGNPKDPGAINGDIRLRDQRLDRPLIMILVDDVETQLQAVKNAGGKVVQPPQAEPAFGLTWAVFSDTEGNHLGVYSYSAK